MKAQLYNRVNNRLTLSLLSVLFLMFIQCVDNLNKPKIGERYILQTENNTYTIIKITAIDKKKVSYLKNDLSVSDIQYIDSIDTEINYSDLPETLTYNDFKTLPLSIHTIKPIKK